MKKSILALLAIALISRVSASTLYIATPSGVDAVDQYGNKTAFAGTGYDVGVAIDSNGSIFASDWMNNKVYKVTSNGVVSIFASGSVLNQPGCMAFDSSGNLYVANEGNNTISKITPSGAVSTFVDTGWSFGALDMYGMAFDSSGNLYVGNETDCNISKITPTGTLTIYATGVDPTGMAFDSQGNLIVANCLSSFNLLQISPSGSTTILSNNNAILDPYGLAFDSSGNLFFSNDNARQIVKLSTDGTLSTYASSYTLGAVGLAFSGTTLPVPEPSTYALFGIGGLGILMAIRKRMSA